MTTTGRNSRVKHLVRMLQEAVETKRKKIPEALEKLEASYRFSLWGWEMSHDFDEPRPEPPTAEEKKQHAEYICRNIHGLMQAIAEKGQKELPSAAIDLLINEGDMAGDILKTVASCRGSQLSPEQRDEIKARLGAAELLSHLVENDSLETDWIKTEIKQLLQRQPVAFAKVFSEKTAAHLDNEDIDLIVKSLIERHYDNDFQWKARLCSGLLSLPQQLSDQQFYAVFLEWGNPQWCGRNAEFFSRERLERFIADGPKHLLISLVNQGIIDSDESLKTVLEKCGGNSNLVDSCGHFFESRHIDDLVRCALANPYGLLKFINQYPDRPSIRQLCETIRITNGRNHGSDITLKCKQLLSERIEQTIDESPAADLELLIDVSPSMFNIKHAPELLRKVESPNVFLYLIRRFIKDLDPEQIDEFIDIIQAKRQLLKRDTSAKGHTSSHYLDDGIGIIIRERDDLEDEQIQKFMDNLRPATAKTLLYYRAARLSPAQTAEIAERFAHIF